MIKIRTPRNLNQEVTPVEGPNCSVALDPPAPVNAIAQPALGPLRASTTSMYIKSNDDFLLSIFEDDMPSPSSSSSNSISNTGNIFKQPDQPIPKRKLKQTKHQSNSKPLRNKKYGCNANIKEEILLSTNEDYEEDDNLSLHMEVEQDEPYKKRPYSRKPRKQRSRKEDVPLKDRIKNRLLTTRRKEAKDESQGDVISDEIPWCEEEKLNLVRGLKEVGHFDFALLQTYVPTRSTSQVKKFFWCHKARHNAKTTYKKYLKPNTSYIMQRASADNLDVSVSFRRNRTNTATPLFSNGEYGEWWSHFLTEIEHQTEPDYLRARRDLMRRIHRRAALGHALFMIREFEEHPSVEETGGVDLKRAYHFLWACFTQQPLPPIDPTTRSFIISQYDKLVQSSLANNKVLGFMDNFKRDIDDCTIRDPLDLPETEDEERHFTQKAKDKSTASTSPTTSGSSSQADSNMWSGVIKHRGWFSKYCSLQKKSYREAQFLFKHNLDDNEPIENQVCPSSELLRNSVFNPLSISMDILKK